MIAKVWNYVSNIPLYNNNFKTIYQQLHWLYDMTEKNV